MVSPSLISLLNVALAINPIGILSLLTLIGIASPQIVKLPVALSIFSPANTKMYRCRL